ncbi:zinc finger CCCH domain-containing protein 31-like [Selaginella moellendorffii]|uniref:zinc finger CCCH domain-containing protein 31-like n=1 Tax=Selaginella moellendorffii TaxID=88036 RepID=UPI000D1C970A|nr:zinc finger CCCH domain-containing protein 31-like [Selaginella moellendorffii]|eukprot:XP_024515211.1 zinc finger CCCH domain-containing protein 31-like [Selaginella moellendorffii]
MSSYFSVQPVPDVPVVPPFSSTEIQACFSDFIREHEFPTPRQPHQPQHPGSSSAQGLSGSLNIPPGQSGCPNPRSCQHLHVLRQIEPSARRENIASDFYAFDGAVRPGGDTRMVCRYCPKDLAPCPFAHPQYYTELYTSAETLRLNIYRSVTGAVIGRGGENVDFIRRLTNVEVGIYADEEEAEKSIVVVLGSWPQIERARQLLDYLLRCCRNAIQDVGFGCYKERLCVDYFHGTCRFGNSCHFAHGKREQRKPPRPPRPS